MRHMIKAMHLRAYTRPTVMRVDLSAMYRAKRTAYEALTEKPKDPDVWFYYTCVVVGLAMMLGSILCLWAMSTTTG